MNEIIQIICDNVVTQYKSDKNILGIALFGSVARGKSDKYSDVDIYILTKDKPDYSRINFIEKNIRVELIFDQITEALKYLKEDEYNVKRITSHELAFAKILYQVNDKFNNLINKAKQNLKSHTKYDNDEMLMHKYSIDDFWGEIQRDYKSNDRMAFELDSHLLMGNIIEIFFKVNGYFLLQPNEMLKFIKEKDKIFSKYLTNYYRAKSPKAKLKIIPKIIEYTYKNIRWFTTRQLESKITLIPSYFIIQNQ
jgi:predicted nucleotidyltransferase